MKASSCCCVETVPDRWWTKPAAQVGSILYLGFRVFWLKILGLRVWGLQLSPSESKIISSF